MNYYHELYYIFGDYEEHDKVIKILEQHGGRNENNLKGDDYNRIYYIDEDGIINDASTVADISRLVIRFGKELILE